MNKEFQHDVFLSHNQADKLRVRQLAERLRAAGLRVWFDEWVIQPGDDIYLAIERGLEASRTLLLCLSPAALGSDWVALERSTVLFRDPANAGRRFIPLLLADCKLPDTLRRYKYVDYREETQPAFDQLLAGCRPQEQGKAIPVAPRPAGRGTPVLDEPSPLRAVWVLGSYSGLSPGELAFTRKLLPLFGAGLAQMRVKLVSGKSDLLGDLAKHYLAVSLSARPPGPAPVEIRGKLRQRDLTELFMEAIGHVPDLAIVIGGAASGRVAEECSAATDAGIPILPVTTTGGAAAETQLTAKVKPSLFAQLAKSPEDSDAGDVASSLLMIVQEYTLNRTGSQARRSFNSVVGRKEEEQRRRADEEVRRNLPPGVKLVRTLRGHAGWIGRIAWSPDGRMLASPSQDKTIRLWDTETGECLRTLEKHQAYVSSVAFDRTSQKLASCSGDRTAKLWEVPSGRVLHSISNPELGQTIVFDPTTQTLAAGGRDGRIRLWKGSNFQPVRAIKAHYGSVLDIAFETGGFLLASVGTRDRNVRIVNVANGDLVFRLEGPPGPVCSVCFSPNGRILASGTSDGVVQVWDSGSGRLLNTLEGHTRWVAAVTFSQDSRLLASKSGDGGVRLWNCETWMPVATLPEPTNEKWLIPGLAFHPRLPLLATVGSDPRMWGEECDRLIHIWELDVPVLLGQVAEPSAHYVNAKVVLVGDTGVGKSGLSLVLNNQPFQATDSTPGRRVRTFDSQEVAVGNNVTQTRETLLWDLAGQPGYRVIHQLHLNEVAVALVVFDARSETDPLAGVRHWERALRLAQQRQGTSGVPMKKFLVSARNDRGGVSIGEDRLQAVLKEFGFDGYFKTSAKEGWEIKELRTAIEQAIEWDKLPEVSSSQLFADIKSFLLEVKKTGRLLAPAGQLYDEFARQHSDTAAKVANMRDQFTTCIGRLENRDLIRRLTFGGYVLLQPELLDAYGSAMVNTAKEEPDGLGSLAEEIALAGKFFVPKEQKVTDPGQEQLLLHATVEELVRHDLALRENADDGRYLVFPSQFNRDYEDAPEPKGKAVAITFDGPVQSLYSTLAVRLGHSGLFTTGRAEMWRNAAVFTAKAGGKCGLFLHEFAEGRGRLILFFPDEHSSAETRFHFEEFVLAHAGRRALDGTVELVRFFVCPDCGDPVPDSYVKRLREKGKMEFNCPCGGTVSLAEPKERIHFRSKVEAMEQICRPAAGFRCVRGVGQR
jgi:GTPase SAR1 family protein